MTNPDKQEMLWQKESDRKEVKVESTAIKEIDKEMIKVTEKYNA